MQIHLRHCAACWPPPSTGSIAGRIVNAGGNTGAVGFGLGFSQFLDTSRLFFLSWEVVVRFWDLPFRASYFIVIQGRAACRSYICKGRGCPSRPAKTQTISVREHHDAEVAARRVAKSTRRMPTKHLSFPVLRFPMLWGHQSLSLPHRFSIITFDVLCYLVFWVFAKKCK